MKFLVIIVVSFLVAVSTIPASAAADLQISLENVPVTEFDRYRSENCSGTSEILFEEFHGDPAAMAQLNAQLIEEKKSIDQRIMYLVKELELPRSCVLKILRLNTATEKLETEIIILSATDHVFTDDSDMPVWEWPTLQRYESHLYKMIELPSGLYARIANN